MSFDIGEADEHQHGVPDDIPYSVGMLMDTAELFGWLAGRRKPFISIIFRYCSIILATVSVSLFLYSAVMAYRYHDLAGCVLRVFAGSFIVHLMFIYMGALGYFSEDLGTFLHRHPLPPMPWNLFVATTLTLSNVSVSLIALRHPDVLTDEFGEVFQNKAALASWFMCILITTPPAASVLALLRCIGIGLCHRLSAVRDALEHGESAAARKAYAHYLKYLREAKPIYQSIASPVIISCVLIVSFVLSVEVYAFAGASRFDSIQQRSWGPMAAVLLLWVAGPPVRLPVEHAKIKLLAAEVACASAERDADAAALAATMNAVGVASGLKVLGSIPLTTERLMQVISYVSLVMGLLRKV